MNEDPTRHDGGPADDHDREHTAAYPPYRGQYASQYDTPDQDVTRDDTAPLHTGRSGVPPYASGVPPYASGTSWDTTPVDTLGNPAPDRDHPRGRRVGAALLASALVLGLVGGVAGALGFEALDEDTTTSAATTHAPLNTASADTSGSSTRNAAAADSPEAVAAEVLPSVVKINVAGPQGQGSGSGIVLSADGEILTNNHVVEVAGTNGQMTVDFNDGTSAKATIVGTDPVSDLAVVQAQDVSGLTPAAIGNSDQLQVGEGVVAIGSPFGLEATVTSGIVSSLNRPVSISGETGTDTTYPAIQTDAAINPGNSGGPLVDLDGKVVGINSSIRTAASSLGGEGGSIGLGFAIPITTVLPIIEQLRNGETPTHARLGVSVSDTASSNGLVSGARIAQVENGAAGDKAGLQAGDIVTRVDDHAITSSEALVATIRGYRPGDTVTITVRRGGDTQELKATLGSDAQTNAS